MTFTLGPSLLFCPADRPERYAKAADRSDTVILDLEDAVAPGDKAAAREALADSANLLDPARTVVRVNPVGTPDLKLDLAAVAKTPYRTLMLAKAESAEQLDALAGYQVLALCETARGVLHSAEIAARPNVLGLMWGAEDLIASLGGTSSRDTGGQYRAVALHARSQVLLAAGSFGKAAIDAVYVNIPDLEGLTAEAEDAVASGFAAKACIHPSQVAAVRASYRPSEDAVREARELLEAAAAAGNGVFSHEGRMIDGPILRHAESVLRRAGQA
ncbi:HpcH/HpaI aldolase/citrate lyase family protein [Arthrobacter sp. NPDC090010]|uniref:HpcH/HpaI aldolase/citrate lyase family protein n=1 Tax=Arthrobacter sp. NPDC090010 TaxID=3363942 RepID=UPI0037F29E36